MSKTVHPFSQSGIGERERVGDGLQAVPFNHFTDGLGTTEDPRIFRLFKNASNVGRASLGKCSLRVRMRVVSRVKYYNNTKIPPHTMCLSSYRNKAFSTQISRKLLGAYVLEVSL